MGGWTYRPGLKLTPPFPVPLQKKQGKRALSFVLKNQGLIDKTLLFNIELLKVKK